MKTTNKNLSDMVLLKGMKPEERNQLYQSLIAKSGHWPQVEMFTEEIGEFLKAVNKLKRTKKCNDVIHYPSVHSSIDYSIKYFHVCSEIADLEILVEQMRLIFCDEAINLAKERALIRQKWRIENDKI